MKNRLKKLNIFFIVLCIIISSIIPTAAFAASEDDLRSSVVSIASNEVGYTGTSSYSKYGDWYGYQGGWCTTFVLWCFNKAGKQNGVTLNGVIIPRGGNCSSMISWFKDKGRYYSPSKYTPKSGDLIFFDWTGSGTADHVGIVNYTSGTTVYTIEGNCSGKVKAREYTKKVQSLTTISVRLSATQAQNFLRFQALQPAKQPKSILQRRKQKPLRK